MYKSSVFIIILLAGLASGCSSTVTRPESSDVPRPVIKALESFTVQMSSDAVVKTANEEQFHVDDLSASLKAALNQEGLISPDGSYRLTVAVDDVRIRSGASAFMFGFMAGDDHLWGDAILSNLEGVDVYVFDVKTSYSLGGVAGADSSRITWLNDKFSEEVAEELVLLRDQSE